MSQLRAGHELYHGKYRIVRPIGHGGFSITYEAKYVLPNTTVCIKELFVSDFCNRDSDGAHISVATASKVELMEKIKKKFLEEATFLLGFSHQNVVRVHDVFEENGTIYYAMSFIEGKSLSALVYERGPLPEAEAVDYIRQVADALAKLHSQNRMHLDIKPENIMVTPQGKAILIDFGVSKQYDEANGHNTSTLLGYTAGYAPLEQMGQNVGKFYPATDIYALGATLYFALTGMTPPPSNALASGEATLQPLPASVSDPIRHAVESAMHTKRTDRPQSIAAWLDMFSATQSASTNVAEGTPDAPHKDDASNKTTVNGKYHYDFDEPIEQQKNWFWIIAAVVALLGIAVDIVLVIIFTMDGDAYLCTMPILFALSGIISTILFLTSINKSEPHKSRIRILAEVLALITIVTICVLPSMMESRDQEIFPSFIAPFGIVSTIAYAIGCPKGKHKTWLWYASAIVVLSYTIFISWMFTYG